jgi:hypothetical protein
MLEFLLGLLEIVFEVFGEFLLELIAEFIGDLVMRSVVAFFEMDEFESPVLAAVMYLFLGACLGGLSLLIAPHPLFHRSRFQGISLLISPVLAGSAMSSVGSMLRSRNLKTIQLETFGCGFAFALGIALIRFIFAS